MLSHCSLLRNPRQKPTDVLEHCREGEIKFLIANFCLVLNVVCFLLGYSPASEFCVPTFRTLSVPSS